MKILLAVDGSTTSNAALDSVARRPWPADTDVEIVTAIQKPIIVGMEPWAATPEYFEQLEKAVKEAGKAVVDAAVKRFGESADKALHVSGQVIEGPASQAIVVEAQKCGADLIVIGSRGLGAWNRLILGSVSSSVVHHANCSVEVVRDRAA
jgi:nucleotide-binding universal stress UspA family protein